MSVALNSIRQKNQTRRTLEAQYALEASRAVPHYDDEAIAAKTKSLKGIASEIKMANAGVDRDVHFLDKIATSLAQELLAKDGIVQPEGNVKGLEGEERKAKEKAIREYWDKVVQVVDKHGADIFVKMDDDQKPFGHVELADGSKQKTTDGALVEAEDEKNKKGKGKRASRVKISKIEDDGSEAEAASDVTVVGVDAEHASTTESDASADSEGNESHPIVGDAVDAPAENAATGDASAAASVELGNDTTAGGAVENAPSDTDTDTSPAESADKPSTSDEGNDAAPADSDSETQGTNIVGIAQGKRKKNQLVPKNKKAVE